MRPPARRTPFYLRPWFITVVFLLVAVGILWGFGFLNLSRYRGSPSTAGLIAVPVSARPIPRYTRLTRDHLWDAKNSRLAMIYLRPEQVSRDMKTTLKDILGNVLDHDKAAGFVFSDSDFLPAGTRPGLVAGIPPGKRAMRVDAQKVSGIFGLQPGDRFDLVSALAIDAGRGNNQIFGRSGGVYGQQLDIQSRMSNWQKQATVRVVVQNGVVVEPMTTRQVPFSARTLTQGSVTRIRPVQEIVIAVDPHEVAPLTEALAVDAEISCVPRSGRPGDPHTITPGLQPRSPFTLPAIGGGMESMGSGTAPGAPTPSSSLSMIETIQGTKRDMVAAPARRERP